MTTLAPAQQIPESFAFAQDTVPLRPVTSSLSSREETQLHVLSHEIVRYAPDLALMLRDIGMDRLSSSLVDA